MSDQMLIEIPSPDSYDGIVCDMDGVLWRGHEEIDGSVNALKALKDSGKTVVFVTNNSARTRAAVAHKLVLLGYDVSFVKLKLT
jgi:glycerol 3-phosphatase-2